MYTKWYTYTGISCTGTPGPHAPVILLILSCPGLIPRTVTTDSDRLYIGQLAQWPCPVAAAQYGAT